MNTRVEWHIGIEGEVSKRTSITTIKQRTRTKKNHQLSNQQNT